MKSLTLVPWVFIAFSSFAQDLIDQHRWKNRVLVICATSVTDSMLLRQQEEFAGCEEGFQERKLITYLSVRGKFRQGSGPFREGDDLNRKFNSTGQAYTATLIGLDGGVKRRYDSPVSCEDLFALIDGMPMRRAEIKRGKN